MNTLFFEDLKVGDAWTSDQLPVNYEDMLAYNRKYDPWPFHADEAAGKESLFGSVIASGGYTVSLAFQSVHNVFNNADTRLAFIAGFDWRLKFENPVKPGDVLSNRFTVLAKKESTKAGRGIVTFHEQLRNQKQQNVLEIEAICLIATRPSAQ